MKFNKLILLFFLSRFFFLAKGQVIRGSIVDAKTGEKLPSANVYYSAKNKTQSNLDGNYALPYRRKKVTVSLIGYNTFYFKPSHPGRYNIRLRPIAPEQLNTAVINGKKRKYSRKDNPAVLLMRKVIAHKQMSDLRQKDFFSYDKYRKLIFALNDVNENTFSSGPLRPFSVLKSHMEICPQTGKKILPLTIDETVDRTIYQKNPQEEKNIILAQRSKGLNQLFTTGGIFSVALEDFFTDVNVYDNSINLLHHYFTSPLSSQSGIDFYRYFIVDTLVVDGEKCIHVDFTPNNPRDMGFSGKLYVAADGSYRVVRAELGLPYRSDVNYVEGLNIIQDFERLPSGEQVLVKDEMLVQLKVTDMLQKFQVRRTTVYSHFSFSKIAKSKFHFKGDSKMLPDACLRSDEFWKKFRPDTLSSAEKKLDSISDNLEQIRGFKPFLWVVKAFVENFVETSSHHPSKVDIGPVNTFFSHNFVGGFRLRAGAQTTANFNKHLFLKGYLAYGFKDRRFKGMANVTYSFIPKAYLPREFPVNNLSFSYASDVMAPSDKFLPTDKDNVFTTLKWAKVNHMMYYRAFRLLYDKEWANNLRLTLQFRREKDEPAAALFYQRLDGKGVPSENPAMWKPFLTTADAMIKLTYHPGARWINTKQRRYSVNKDHPVISLSHTMGLKGVWGSENKYNLTEVSLYKRYWLNSWGKMNFYLKAGAEWNRAPYPLLIMPPADLSYIMQNGMFNLIHNMEFLNDRYASLIFSWDMNGKLFNRIPLLRKLQWRENFGIKALWGGLTDKNNPFLPQNSHRSDLFYFPGVFSSDGAFSYASSVMNPRMPYVEASFGIHNIFKVLHVEYVRRLTYVRHLHKNENWGIRVMLHLAL